MHLYRALPRLVNVTVTVLAPRRNTGVVRRLLVGDFRKRRLCPTPDLLTYRNRYVPRLRVLGTPLKARGDDDVLVTVIVLMDRFFGAMAGLATAPRATATATLRASRREDTYGGYLCRDDPDSNCDFLSHRLCLFGPLYMIFRRLILILTAALSAWAAGSATAVTTIRSWATTGSDPRDIAIDASGNVYTVNTDAETITKVTPDGTRTTSWATTGSSPVGIAIDASGNVYTANNRGYSITKVTPDGIATQTWARTGAKPADIAIDASGNVYTGNRDANTITKVTPDGTRTTSWAATGARPHGIAIDGSGNVYTANYSANSITRVVLDSYPAPPATASAPSAVASDGAATITVARNATSGRYGAPSSYLVQVVGDSSKSCIAGPPVSRHAPSPALPMAPATPSRLSPVFQAGARLPHPLQKP